jgi:DNA-binding NarL/FixJ family response regulator
MSKITILLVDDHPIVLDGLKNLLESHPDFQIVGEAVNGEEAIAKVKSLRPQVVLMDISIPKMNGHEATKIIVKKFPKTKVIVLTMIEEAAYAGKLIEAGASGYLLKDTGSDEIIKAIQRVADGETYFSQKAYELIGQHLSKSQSDLSVVSNEMVSSLTHRESEILLFIAEGLSSQEIAKKLFLSPRTVETHRANIMHKLHIHSTAGLVRFVFDNKMITV